MRKRKKSSNKHAPQVRSEIFLRSVPLLGLAGVALIAIAAFIAYLPSIHGEFILDDDQLLTKNDLINAPDGLYKFWCTTESLDYWPATNTTFWIEWRLWGMNPTGYHASNLILHVVESLLIWLILRKLSIPGAFWAAMIFAVHPVNVESVAWIASRKNTMAMLFFLLSILFYLKWEIHCPLSPVPSPLFYWLSLAAFVLAMLSKGSVAVLPVLLLGIIWWLRKMGTVPIFVSTKMGLSPSISRWDLVRIAPFFIVAVALAGVNIWFQTHGSGKVFRTAGFVERLLGAGGVVWFYLYKALLPFDLSFVYPKWHIQAGNPLWWLPLSALFAVTAVLWRYRWSWSRPLLFAWGFVCVALAPVMGFVDVGFMQYSLVADHYQHIALVGAIALPAALWSVWRQRTRDAARLAASVVAIAAVGILAFLTWRQNELYSDPLILYQATLEKNPDCSMAHNNLGAALYQTGRFQAAIEHYEQAMRLDPKDPQTNNNTGLALTNAGRLQEAVKYFRQALELKKNFPEAHNNLGLALYKAGRLQEAIEHYQQALLLKPNYPDALNNLGNALSDTGRLPEAINYYEQTVRLKPDHPDVYNNLGIALFQTGRPKEAIEYFMKALELKPDSIDVYSNLALIYASMHQSSKAVAAAQKALEFSRSQGKAAQAKQIEDRLKSYRASLSDPPGESPSREPASPPP